METRPLAAGLDAAAFLVDDLERAIEDLEGCTFSEPVPLESGARGIRRAVAGQAPDGIRFELWQR